MQKLNYILKILFNNELTPHAKKVKTFHTIETKWDNRNSKLLSCQDTNTGSQIEKIRELILKIHVQCLSILRFF